MIIKRPEALSTIDFIDFGWWPIFNFADVGIAGGLLLAFWR
jgi:lipoprotein signal peptidase